MDLERNSAVANGNDLTLDVAQILANCRSLSDSANVDGVDLHKNMEHLKSQFYSALNQQKENADELKLGELAQMEAQFKELYSAYKSEKRVQNEDMERVKEEIMLQNCRLLRS